MPDLTKNQGKTLHTLAVLADAGGPGEYHSAGSVALVTGLHSGIVTSCLASLTGYGYAEQHRIAPGRYVYRLTYEGTVLSNRVTASGDVRDA